MLLIFLAMFSLNAVYAISGEEKLSYCGACDSALKYSFCNERLSKWIGIADSIRLGHNYENNWRLSVAKAWQLFRKAEYDSVAYMLDKEIKYMPADSSLVYQMSRAYHIAQLNKNLMRYSEASLSFEEMKVLAEKSGNIDYIAEAYWGLESIARITHDYELARQYLEKLMEALKGDSSYRIFRTYQYYAQNAIRRDDQFTARDYLKKCIGICKDSSIRIYNLPYELSWLYNQLGQVCNTLGNTKEGAHYYRESIVLSSKANMKQIMSDSYANLGIYYWKQEQYDSALFCLDQCLKHMTIPPDRNLLRISNYYLSAVYDSLGDYQKAYGYQKAYAAVLDSISNSEYRELYVQERTRFQTEQKDKELEVLAANIRMNKILLYSSIAFSALVIVIIVLLYRQNRLRSRQKLSQLQKQVSEARQEYLRKQMNPHFLFNTLNSIQYFMYNNDKIATNDYMSKFAMLIRKSLENSENTYTTIKDELDALKLYVELEQLRFKNKFNWELIVDEDIDVLQQKIPSMIIHPFVENAINHGLHFLSGNGKLRIELKQLDYRTIECVVEDNGIGREKAEEIKRLKSRNHQSMGTSMTRERLKILGDEFDHRLKVNYTDLFDANKRPIGTKVVIIMPVIN